MDIGFGDMLGGFSSDLAGVADSLSGSVQDAADTFNYGVGALDTAQRSIDKSYNQFSGAIRNLTGYALPPINNSTSIPNQVYTGVDNWNAPSVGVRPSPVDGGSYYPASNPDNTLPAYYPDGTRPDYSLTPAFWDTNNNSPFAGSSGVWAIAAAAVIIVILAVKRG